MKNFSKCSEEERERILEEKKENPFLSGKYLEEKYQYYATVISQFFVKNHCTTRDLTGLRCRKYNVNDNYFSKIDSHEKAYLLGVWYSDGYLVIEGNNTKRIGLDVKDVDWLIDIGKELKSEAPLYKTNKENLKRLKITSVKMYDDLIKLGCLEHKTFLLDFPQNNQVPFEFLNSFILGLLDGDGSITIATPRKEGQSPEIQMTFTGTKQLLEGIQKYLGITNLKLYQRWAERNNNNYTLQIAGTKRVASILTLLYKNAPAFCLKRKKDKYEKIINDSRIKSKDLMLIPANPYDNGV